MRASKTEMAVNARWVRIWPFAEFMATLCLKRAEKAKHPLRHKPTAASGSGHASRSRLAPQESPFSPRHLPTWRNWVPHSYGAGRCESMGAARWGPAVGSQRTATGTAAFIQIPTAALPARPSTATAARAARVRRMAGNG